jgi:LmbE family N-acetylglucosaminyl deacetylase
LNDFHPVPPVVFISPHLDDVALSCAKFLHDNPGSTVITVLAGAPKEDHFGYNARTTGEQYAPAAIQVRRDEDARAMSILSAHCVWLDLLDGDYFEAHSSPKDQLRLRDSIRDAIDESGARSVIAPLGLIHADHAVVSNACLDLARHSMLDWYFYMEMPYGQALPRKMTRRLKEIRKTVNMETLEPYSGNADVKNRVIRLYASQYRHVRRSFPSGYQATIVDSEQYWRIH